MHDVDEFSELEMLLWHLGEEFDLAAPSLTLEELSLASEGGAYRLTYRGSARDFKTHRSMKPQPVGLLAAALVLVMTLVGLLAVSTMRTRSDGRAVSTTVSSISAPGSVRLDGPFGSVGESPRLLIPALGIDSPVHESCERLHAGVCVGAGVGLLPAPHGLALFGHRTVFGAVFNRLDEIQALDRVDLTGDSGTLSLTIESSVDGKVARNLEASEVDEVAQSLSEDEVLLVTFHPKYSNARRLVVLARVKSFDALGPPISSLSLGSETPASAVIVDEVLFTGLGPTVSVGGAKVATLFALGMLRFGSDYLRI